MEASVHTFTTVYHVGLYVQSSVVITVSVHRWNESSETYFLNERYHSGAAFLVNKLSDFTSKRNHAYPRLRGTSTKPVEQLPGAGCEIGIVVSKKCRSRMVPLI